MVRSGKTAETGMTYNCPYWKVNPAGTGHPLEAGWTLIPLRFEYAAFCQDTAITMRRHHMNGRWCPLESSPSGYGTSFENWKG